MSLLDAVLLLPAAARTPGIPVNRKQPPAWRRTRPCTAGLNSSCSGHLCGPFCRKIRGSHSWRCYATTSHPGDIDRGHRVVACCRLRQEGRAGSRSGTCSRRCSRPGPRCCSGRRRCRWCCIRCRRRRVRRCCCHPGRSRCQRHQVIGFPVRQRPPSGGLCFFRRLRPSASCCRWLRRPRGCRPVRRTVLAPAPGAPARGGCSAR
jgi:hypothetical protein